jgi:hypothetical protein
MSVGDGGNGSGGAGAVASGGAAGAGGGAAEASSDATGAGGALSAGDAGATSSLDSAGLCLALAGVTPSCPAWAPHVYMCADGERMPRGETGCVGLDLYPASVTRVCPEAGVEAGADAGCRMQVVALPHQRQMCCP